MTAIERLLSAIVRGRSHLPAGLNRLIDDVGKNPDGIAGRLASTVLGGHRASNRPAPTAAPQTPIRVYIGPTNYAGQGYRWARALEASDPRIGARSMAVTLPGGFSFPTDTAVPVAVHNVSLRWQQAELEAVSGFTHVLFEAGSSGAMWVGRRRRWSRPGSQSPTSGTGQTCGRRAATWR